MTNDRQSIQLQSGTGLAATGASTATSAIVDGSTRLVELTSPEQVGEYGEAWQGLIANAAERVPFYEPWMLVPAWQELAVRPVCVLLVFDIASGIMIGAFPIECKKDFLRFPVAYLSLWRHIHCPLCTPEIRRGYEQQALEGLFAWADRHQKRGSFLLFEHVAAEGPFAEALREFIAGSQRTHFKHESWERAFFIPAATAEEYIKRGLSGKKRKELRRQLRRLSEQGSSLETVELTSKDNLDEWLDDFFALEQSGWKGRGGSAIADRPNERRYFDDACRRAFENEELLMLKLSLNGRPVAMKCNYMIDGGGYAAKIAYDEEFQQYSPGVQLELKHIELLHKRDGIRWVDSCAMPNHFMIERLWTERRAMQSLAVASRSLTGRILLSSLPPIRRLYQTILRKETR
jgi:hypothetical protein